MSTGQSAVMLCGWTVKARYGSFHQLHVWVEGETVKLCDPSLTPVNLSALQMNIARITKRYTNVQTSGRDSMTPAVIATTEACSAKSNVLFHLRFTTE